MERNNSSDSCVAKRNIILFIIFVVLAVLLLARLFYIQIICHEEFEKACQSQYQLPVDGMDTRGSIVDRNYMPLTGGTCQYYYFISKEQDKELVEELSCKLGGRQIASKESAYWVYRTENYDEEVNEMIKDRLNAYVFRCQARYGDEQMACHLIGYLNEDEKVGVSGLELMYQQELEADDSNMYLWADAAGGILPGSKPYISYKEGSFLEMTEEKTIVTTIDRRLQYVTETALAQKTESGAAVVMDAQTGEILAWASRPSFNPNNIEDYLESGSDCLINKVSQASYPPGSVFKIVTALAALENGIDPDEEFECTGEAEVGGVKVGCNAGPKDGHGTVNMKDAMAQSCNCYFSTVGEMIGYEDILMTARKLGYGEATLKDFPEETAGNVPENEETGVWDTSNISIGQGQLLATPIQVCQMTAVIANGGYLVKPRLVMGETLLKENVASNENTKLIEEYLKAVIDEGTGMSRWNTRVYGKTGTAEAGSGGAAENVCWFTGYCRQNEKNYVITVMTEGGESATSDALPIFKRITDFLAVL